MKFKAVVFDLDGTLLDTLVDIGNGVNRVLETNGFPRHPLESYRYFMGDGPRQLIIRALPPEAQRPEVIEICLKGYLAAYNRQLNQNTELFPQIGPLLDQLTEKGLKLAVLTNKRHELAQACMGQFFGAWSFWPVLGFRDDVPPKPNPAAALEIAQKLALAPEACLFVGDSDVDMATAKAAGMLGAGAVWGYRSSDELRRAGAALLLENPLDLLDAL
ncbi:MAG: HAD family hydrolase [Desulfobacterales bacterium]|jgi:phosphoglycolate phosphatase